MKRFLPPGGILLIAVVVVLLVFWASYNRLVGLDEGVEAAWSQVENVYQRRADLVPNLVKTVQGARNFERETLDSLVAARAKVGQQQLGSAPNANQLTSFQAQQAELGSALSRLLAVVENYPELKATEAFRDLQSQLEGAENRIAVERQRFNETARMYNTARRRFPAVLVADWLGFGERAYFESAEGSGRPPAVEFSR